jgi:hypothetical protein
MEDKLNYKQQNLIKKAQEVTGRTIKKLFWKRQ